jgi:hypothetical protein
MEFEDRIDMDLEPMMTGRLNNPVTVTTVYPMSDPFNTEAEETPFTFF